MHYGYCIYLETAGIEPQIGDTNYSLLFPSFVEVFSCYIRKFGQDHVDET